MQCEGFPFETQVEIERFVLPMRASTYYALCGKRARNPRLVAFFNIRRAARPEFSGRGALAAANSRARWVLVDGCPVLSVHCSFGLALHMGQRTDKIRRNVSFSGFTQVLFRIARWKDVQSCSWDFNCPKTGASHPSKF